jgi:hypothetical protein
MANTTSAVVYLIVHELFGLLSNGKEIELVTPVVPVMPAHPERKHEYRIARFRDGRWTHQVNMQHGEKYELRGVDPRKAVATPVPCHETFSPHPPGKLKLNPKKKPFCRWHLPLPKQIHQLRLVSVRDADRPIFTGDPHGDTVDTQMTAVSLVQAFEYKLADQNGFGIFDSNGNLVKGLDYQPDTKNDPPTINLHLWAQLENEKGMDDAAANEHAQMATDALVKLFSGLTMTGGGASLSINDLYSTQLRMPAGIRFPELMTLAEKFVLRTARTEQEAHAECTGKTCGHGGNIFAST